METQSCLDLLSAINISSVTVVIKYHAPFTAKSACYRLQNAMNECFVIIGTSLPHLSFKTYIDPMPKRKYYRIGLLQLEIIETEY